MFDGNQELAQRGPLAVAVPGEIKGYWELHQREGILPWKELFLPTIELCRSGFPVTKHTAKALLEQTVGIHDTPSMHIFIDPKTGDVYKEGDTIKRETLANTLEILANAEDAAHEFYEGEIGRLFVEDLQALGGNITMEDMKNYE